jgi:hypothetical protein
MAKSNQNSNSEVEAPPIPPVKAKAPIKEELYDYLPKRIIQVRAVPATEEQWAEILSNTPPAKQPFLFDNVKRGYTVPESQALGRLVEVFDTKVARKSLQFSEEALTQHEVMEKLLGKNLSYFLAKDSKESFWYNDRLATVELMPEGDDLDLSTPIDNLRYHILKANKSKIAENITLAKRFRGKFQFFFASPSDNQAAIERAAVLKKKAMNHFLDITSTVTKMKNFLRIAGIAVDENTSDSFMLAKMDELFENNPVLITSIAEDPNFDVKSEIYAAVAIKALYVKKRGEHVLYEIAETGESLGTLSATVVWWENPENDELVDRIRNQIVLIAKK